MRKINIQGASTFSGLEALAPVLTDLWCRLQLFSPHLWILWLSPQSFCFLRHMALAALGPELGAEAPEGPRDPVSALGKLAAQKEVTALALVFQ
jgi:hypothetical protein